MKTSQLVFVPFTSAPRICIGGEAAGRRLEAVAPEVLVEVFAISIEPNKLRLSLAASAARYAARVADEPLKTEAVALAEELEQRSA